MWGTTHKVLLNNNYMVHSRNCTFDIYDVGTGERLPEATEVSLGHHHQDHLMDMRGHNKTTPLGQTTPTKHRNPLMVTPQGIARSQHVVEMHPTMTQTWVSAQRTI